VAEASLPRARPLSAHPVTYQGRRMVALHDRLGLLQGQPALAQEAYLVLVLLDGRRSLEMVMADWSRITGRPSDRAQMEGLIHEFDRLLLLESPGFETALASARERFEALDHRPACQAGVSYPARANELRGLLNRFLAQAGERAGPETGPGHNLSGLVVPHIDLERGGAVYGTAFRSLPEGLSQDRLVVLLGTAHAPTMEKFALCDKDFVTPLGRARADGPLSARLLKLQGGRFGRDGMAHLGEHSLEFGLLFLQYLVGPGLRILPLLCGGLPAASEGLASPGYDRGEEELLGLLGEVVREEEALVVMGADLAHVGPQFGHLEPVGQAELKLNAEADRALLTKAVQRDAEGFFRAVAGERDQRNICGLAPILAGLRILPPGPGRILDYGQWLDEKGQGGVTFAALAFDRS